MEEDLCLGNQHFEFPDQKAPWFKEPMFWVHGLKTQYPWKPQHYAQGTTNQHPGSHWGRYHRNIFPTFWEPLVEEQLQHHRGTK